MKWFLVILSVFLSSCNAWGGGAHIVSQDAGIDITTEKVIHIDGMIGPDSLLRYAIELNRSMELPGDQVIIINSGGGYVSYGKSLISLLEAEQLKGTRVICIADEDASSMAFNFMSFCNVRLATKGTVFVVHKVEVRAGYNERETAKNHRQMARLADQLDEPFREQNAKTMHLPLSVYDKYADAETQWTVKELLGLGWLNGIATIN